MPDRPSPVRPAEPSVPGPGGASALARRLRAIGLRSRLALLGLALILPWAVVTSLVVVGFRRDRERDGFARAAEQARLVAARVDDQIRAVNALLLVLSRTAGAAAADTAANDRLLRSLGDHLPGAFVNLAVWDSAGRNVGVSFEDSAIAAQARAVNARDRRFFRDALAGRERVVGELVRTVRTGRWGISLAQPIVLTQLGMIVGYDSSELIFFSNYRLRRARLEFSDGSSQSVSFSDQRGMQYVALAPVRTQAVTVVIEDVYPTPIYDDTPIAEIRLVGYLAR